MAISNYTELQAAIKSWLHRGDLDAKIPDFITLGEARLNRLLRHRSMRTSAAVTPSTTLRYVSLPTRYLDLLSFTDDAGDPVRVVTPGQLEAAASGAATGRPAYCAIGSRIDFERVADAAYSFTMVYWKRLGIASDATNDVLTEHPDAYLYASLLSAAPYLRNRQAVADWNDMLTVAVREANEVPRGHMVLRTELGAGAPFDISSG